MSFRTSSPARRTVVAVTLAALTAATVAAGGGTATAAPIAPHVAQAPIAIGHTKALHSALATPPTTADCQARYGINCYSPVQLEQAYGTPTLYSNGITGRGRTIAIVDSFGSPTIAHDLQVFDQTYGLPDVPSLRIIQPAGQVPAFDPTDDVMNGWAGETTLDVEYAHAMAPEANLLLVETPVAETEGVTGLPQMVKAENYVIDHGLADVISQSFGATENTFPSKAALLGLRSAFVNAAKHGVSVLGSSGDAGATDAQLDGTTLYPYRVSSWPSSDPLVTSVGGTQLTLDADGNRTAPDVAWNDGYGAGGGGVSMYFPRPVFQDGDRSVVGNARGVPDISLSAAVDGGAITYSSYDPTATGFGIVGGTSEAAPLFAGVVALADQVAGRSLGDLNPSLYALSTQRRSGIVDVRSGTNTFGGVTGYPAGRGYDLATGLGTIDAATFVPALAAQAGGPQGAIAGTGDRTVS